MFEIHRLFAHIFLSICFSVGRYNEAGQQGVSFSGNLGDLFPSLHGNSKKEVYFCVEKKEDVMLNTDKNLKLYYSISEVAAMFDVNESLLRFWEKEFPQLNPKKGGRGIRQYRQEDIETVKLIYHLVKERGMTLPGARQRMKDNKEMTMRNFEIVERLKAVREELMDMRDALDAFTYEDVEKLKENLQGLE